MIITDIAKKIRIEKHYQYDGMKDFALVRNLTGEEIGFVELTVNESPSYYSVRLPELEDGEYTYKVLLNGEVIETGLLYFGKINTEKTEYITENKIYTYERK